MPEEKITLLQRLVADDASVWGYLWFVVLAVWGGTANYISRARRERDHVFSVVELMGEWTISGFSGLLTAYLCAEAGFSYYITAVACAIAGHMGGRAICIIEGLFKSRLPSVSNVGGNADNKEKKND